MTQRLAPRCRRRCRRRCRADSCATRRRSVGDTARIRPILPDYQPVWCKGRNRPARTPVPSRGGPGHARIRRQSRALAGESPPILPYRFVDWYPGRTAPRRRSSASFRANINGRSARSEVEAFGAGIDGLGRQLLHESGAVAPRRAGNRPPFRPNTTGADIRRFWRATERGHGARARSAATERGHGARAGPLNGIGTMCEAPPHAGDGASWALCSHPSTGRVGENNPLGLSAAKSGREPPGTQHVWPAFETPECLGLFRDSRAYFGRVQRVIHRAVRGSSGGSSEGSSGGCGEPVPGSLRH